MLGGRWYCHFLSFNFLIMLFFSPNKGKKLEGESGELVCVKPFPSMPASFWNDPKGEKYHRAYFDKYPGGIYRAVLPFR